MSSQGLDGCTGLLSSWPLHPEISTTYWGKIFLNHAFHHHILNTSSWFPIAKKKKKKSIVHAGFFCRNEESELNVGRGCKDSSN